MRRSKGCRRLLLFRALLRGQGPLLVSPCRFLTRPVRENQICEKRKAAPVGERLNRYPMQKPGCVPNRLLPEGRQTAAMPLGSCRSEERRVGKEWCQYV